MISTKKDCMYSNNSDVGTGEQGGRPPMPPPLSMGGGGASYGLPPHPFQSRVMLHIVIKIEV